MKDQKNQILKALTQNISKRSKQLN